MIGRETIKSALKRNEYTLYTSSLYYMDYAVAHETEDGILPVVVIADNRGYALDSKKDFRLFENIIKFSNNVPQNYPINFLYVVIGYGKTKEFSGRNIIYVSSDTGKMQENRVDACLVNATNIVENAVDRSSTHDSYFISKVTNGTHYYDPKATFLLVFINIIVYFLTADSYGAYGYSPQSTLNGDYAKLLTYMFVHAGMIHLVGNTVSLCCIGIALEKYIGSVRMSVIYIISGLYGALFDVSLNASSSTVTVGASGAICGLLTALIIKVLMTSKVQRMYSVSSLVQTVITVLISGIIIRNTNNMTHIGGMIAGVVTMLIICMADRLDFYRKQTYDLQFLKLKNLAEDSKWH